MPVLIREAASEVSYFKFRNINSPFDEHGCGPETDAEVAVISFCLTENGRRIGPLTTRNTGDPADYVLIEQKRGLAGRLYDVRTIDLYKKIGWHSGS